MRGTVTDFRDLDRIFSDDTDNYGITLDLDDAFLEALDAFIAVPLRQRDRFLADCSDQLRERLEAAVPVCGRVAVAAVEGLADGAMTDGRAA